MKRTVFKEVTNDHGTPRKFYASDNNAEYIITSAYAHDLYTDYVDRYDRHPSAAWYNRHFNFTRIK